MAVPLSRLLWVSLLICLPICAIGQSSSSPSSSSRQNHPAPKAQTKDGQLDPGSVTNSTYRNKSLSLTCEIPLGWVLRTDELNAPDEDSDDANTTAPPADSKQARVLLAAFSRPPDARGEDVNASIIIAAESASAYPGLKEAVQYLGPIAEVAKAQGFTMAHEPYEIAIGAKPLAREDFKRDVGTRVMRQSTLVFLAKGYAVSLTFIGGTEDDVEELIGALSFAAPAQATRP